MVIIIIINTFNQTTIKYEIIRFKYILKVYPKNIKYW